MGHRYKEVDRCCSEKFSFERDKDTGKREKVRELRGHGKYYGHQQSL